MSEEAEANPPPGWVLATGRGAFTTHNGPLYRFDDGKVWRRGFRALPRHCNTFGLIHGGWYMAFVDGVLGEAVARTTGTPSLTVRMTSDFLHTARAGDWIEGTARTTRATRTLAFAEAELYCGERLLFTATGVFKLMQGHAARRRSGLSPKPPA